MLTLYSKPIKNLTSLQRFSIRFNDDSWSWLTFWGHSVYYTQDDVASTTCARQNDVENAGDDCNWKRHWRNCAMQRSVFLFREDDGSRRRLVSRFAVSVRHGRFAYLHAVRLRWLGHVITAAVRDVIGQKWWRHNRCSRGTIVGALDSCR